jgi:hypothetical protein
MSRYRFLFGPLAAAVLCFGIVGLALMVPGYSHVHQTVSELGELGSPARVPFAIMLCCVAACILIFAWAVRDLSLEAGRTQSAAYIAGAMAISIAGAGVFAFPHPLHNFFGTSELIGYQAPLAFALTWRRDLSKRTGVVVSWIMFGLIWGAIAANFITFYRDGQIWAYVKPIYGLVQRSLFVTWFSWCAWIGVLLFQRADQPGGGASQHKGASAQRGAGRRSSRFSIAMPMASKLRSNPLGPSISTPTGIPEDPRAAGMLNPGIPALLPGSVF